jgi:hypothetical protein
MTIATTNVGVAAVRAELGLSYSAGDNISLSDMNTKHIAVDLSNTTDSRFTLTKRAGITMTTDDVATSNQNALTSNPSSLGEWRSYDYVNPIVFSSYGASYANEDQTVQGELASFSTSGCIGYGIKNSVELYCKRVGNDIVWYGGEGRWGSTHTTSTEGGAVITSDTEVARLAGAATTSSTGDTTVSVAISTAYNSWNIFTAGPANTSSGSTNSQLTSTNTKVGYESYTSGYSDCIAGGAYNVHRWANDFTVTPVGMNARVFRFYTGYSIYAITQTHGSDCC